MFCGVERPSPCNSTFAQTSYPAEPLALCVCYSYCLLSPSDSPQRKALPRHIQHQLHFHQATWDHAKSFHRFLSIQHIIQHLHCENKDCPCLLVSLEKYSLSAVVSCTFPCVLFWIRLSSPTLRLPPRPLIHGYGRCVSTVWTARPNKDTIETYNTTLIGHPARQPMPKPHAQHDHSLSKGNHSLSHRTDRTTTKVSHARIC